MNPDFFRGIMTWLILTLIGYHALDYYFEIDFILQIFIALNAATFLLVAIDKFAASMRMRRIPEKVFYLATLLGGSVGMLVGMYTIRHKTRKTSFQMVVGILVLLQIAAILYFVG